MHPPMVKVAGARDAALAQVARELGELLGQVLHQVLDVFSTLRGVSRSIVDGQARQIADEFEFFRQDRVAGSLDGVADD